VLIVLVWFSCVSVLRIAPTKLKIAFLLSVNKQESRYFGSLSLLPGPLWRIFLLLIMPKHPANSADRFGVVWLCFYAPNRPNGAENCLVCVRKQARKPLFWQSQFAPQPPMVNIFVAYHAQAPYQQC
jgi:hypothetical protein